ncbi:expansin-B15-like [Impatiens glandulifera]|uniref:expansin-B15-like n=1 Tax=Impatiens glandulifera TaxID=253017 RepID=UPI001FB04EC1|nr:expansin-B15-like [Impatiens glandulifera]
MITREILWRLPSTAKSASAFVGAGGEIAGEEKKIKKKAIHSEATWYGSPDGAGSDGGACGFCDAVESIYGKYITAVGNGLYKGGKGCGACYEVKCLSHSACSGNSINVVVSDQCPGCDPYQFDLSGTSFGALASNGSSNQLRGAGRIQIEYQKVPCKYNGETIKFVVDNGSNPYYIAVNIMEVGGDGDLENVEIQQGSNPFMAARLVFGATWGVNSFMPGPLSIRLTTSSGKSIVAQNVIPKGWQSGTKYSSNVQF